MFTKGSFAIPCKGGQKVEQAELENMLIHASCVMFMKLALLLQWGL